MKQTESERERDLVATMTRLADSLVAGFDPLELLQDLSESCARVLDTEGAGVTLHGGDALRFAAATDGNVALMQSFELDHTEGPCHDAFRERRHVASSDLDESRDRWPVWSPRAIELGFRAADAFPLRLRDQTIGALSVYARRPRTLHERDVGLGQAFARIATIGLLQHRLVEHHVEVRYQLEHALNSRVVIEQAKGIIAERHDIGVGPAFEVLRDHARSTNTRMTALARRVIDGELDLPNRSSPASAPSERSRAPRIWPL